MDSRIGLDYIVENKEYTAKLAAALDTNNITIKKQVFELLSALSVYSSDGYNRTIDALEHYKILKCERYRFKIVINELRSDHSIEYKTALVAFINCVVISTPQLKDRVRIRNEFIGLKVLDVLGKLRQDSTNDSDLGVQLDVFEEQRETDEGQLSGPSGVDLNSHVDVFYAILRQVAETPQEIPFLSLLQLLLRIDPKEPISDVIWDTAEKLMHRATLLENVSDSARLLRTPSHKSLAKLKGDGRCLCSCHRDESKSRKQSFNLAENLRSQPLTSSTSSVPIPPPPPPPPIPGCCIPPPPPPPGTIPSPPGNIPTPPGNIPPPPPPGQIPPPPGGIPPPPPNNFNGPIPPGSPSLPKNLNKPIPEVDKVRLPQMDTPKPKTKMKTFNWNKIPNSRIIGKLNIWSNLAKTHKSSPKEALDWEELEGLFCQQTAANIGVPSPIPSRGNNKENNEIERKKKESSEIVLLDGKRSLNVNIFLKQFRVSNNDIMNMIKEGEHSDIGAEKLRGLLKLLPEADELEMLKTFSGDKKRLATAEKFLLQLLDVPHYKIRIEAMLLKEEFESTVEQIEPSVNAIIYTARDLISNSKFHDILYMVLVAGNFLNNGGYAGGAGGMKLSSLQKLTDIRANKPGMNLLHFVALQALKKDKKLLNFTEEMSCLEEATKTTIDQLKNELSQLNTRIQKLSNQLKNPKCPAEIHSQMGDFLRIAAENIESLQEGLQEAESIKIKVADFFCEDPNSFKMEESFKVISTFCQRIRQAVAENERRKLQEEQAEIRRRKREENLVKRRSYSHDGPGTVRPGSYSGSESETTIMDHLLFDIRSGFPQRKYSEMQLQKPKRNKKIESLQNGGLTSEDEPSFCGSPKITRRRVESFSSPTQQQDQQALNDNSPDITPNGSIRRRRSRVASEEDDHKLMDYLHTAGHDGSRERKSLAADGYGSLDRSFIRRNRGSGGRTRPNYLASESDREKPASPTATTVSNAQIQSQTDQGSHSDYNRPSKNFRQKIESWFKDNEKEEKRCNLKRRLQEHRKSLDLDTAVNVDETLCPGTGPPSLHTLPEGRPSDTTEGYRRVYHDRKPSVEKADSVRTMEAIEETQTPSAVKEKDKSSWRKSNLNVSNSSESIPTAVPSASARRIRRNRSKSSIDPVHIAQSMEDFGSESDSMSRRSSLIQELGRVTPQDTISLYIRRPSEESHGSINDSSFQGNHYDREDLPNVDTKTQNLLEKMKQTTDLGTDVLKTIEEIEKCQDSYNVPEKRHKKIYQLAPSPSEARSVLHETMKNNINTSNIEETIRSLKGNEKELNDKEGESVNDVLLPPSVPKHMRNISLEDNNQDKIEVDDENIETPPPTRKPAKIISSEKNWSTNANPKENDEFIGRRNLGRYRSLNSEDRRMLVGESNFVRDKNQRSLRIAVDSSETEGNGSELDDKCTTRRSMRLKKLAAFAKNCDTERESMLALQSKNSSEVDEDLGEGKFNRFASVRKTLRHKKVVDKGDSKSQDESSATKHGRVSRQNSNTVKSNTEPIKVGSDQPSESWREKLTRKFRNIESYDVQKSAKENKGNLISEERKTPATEQLHRKNKEELTKGLELRSSFRALNLPSLRRNSKDRNNSAIDSGDVQKTIEKEKVAKEEIKFMQKLDSRGSLGGFRRNASLNRSTKDRYRSSAGKQNSFKDERDEGFEDTISIKSETNSQEATSMGDVNDSNTQEKLSISLNQRLKKLGKDSTFCKESNDIYKSNSKGSLKSSRSSLTSGTSVNTVLATRPISNSASNTSIVSSKSDKNITPNNSFIGFTSNTDIISPRTEYAPSYYGEANTSLHSPDGLLQRPISRNNSGRSIGSSGKYSTDIIVRKAIRANGIQVLPTGPAKSINVKKSPTTFSSGRLPNIVKSNKSATSNIPNGSAKVRRNESGSFKENVEKVSSRTKTTPKSTLKTYDGRDIRIPLIDRSPSIRTATPRMDNSNTISRKKVTSGIKRSSQLPAFMRPTTASASKISNGGTEPIKKGKIDHRPNNTNSRFT